ncbi:hypothetical protein Droror1_Dr00027334 [Drosera rotundifolia]
MLNKEFSASKGFVLSRSHSLSATHSLFFYPCSSHHSIAISVRHRHHHQCPSPPPLLPVATLTDFSLSEESLVCVCVIVCWGFGSLLTFVGVRRLLEEDLGFDMYALDPHKKFVKTYLKHVFLICAFLGVGVF